MKIKISKRAIVALVFVFLMGGSTIAYSFLQAFSPPTASLVLPEKNIINYEIGKKEENYLISRGVTIAKFYYTQVCEECWDQKNFLESFVKQNSNQILLEEIESNETGIFPKLILTSFLGRKILENATNEEVLNAFCDLMYSPPAYCAAREI